MKFSRCETLTCTTNLQFGPKNFKAIAQYLQMKYEQYRNFETARTFVYRVVKWFNNVVHQPHLNSHRDHRDENRRMIKGKMSGP